MKNKMLLRKTCSVYASDTHFATLMFPFISKETKKKVKVITILEKNEKENIENILKNVGLNSKLKEKIRTLDWEETNINKIRNNFDKLEGHIKNKKNIDIIVLGERNFIQKINKAIDLWFKNKIEEIEKSDIVINVINCFSFYEETNIYSILNNHEYILKTTGIEELVDKNIKYLKAN